MNGETFRIPRTIYITETEGGVILLKLLKCKCLESVRKVEKKDACMTETLVL